ncbi:MAG TPA: CoF synthetase [Planctomycetaceae bacterium]|nr:CoF synthetase [Planctomycetaceae bacterium]
MDLPTTVPRPRSRADIDARKLARLRRVLRVILPTNRFYAAKLGRGVTVERLGALADIASWPFTTKEDLVAAAVDGRPGNLTWSDDRYVRFHQTSGTHGRPLPAWDTAADWRWWMECWKCVLGRGHVGRGDRVLVASSFGPYVGFWSAFDAAASGGALAIPAGGLSSLARLELLRRARATVLVATPSYALHLAEVAVDAAVDTAALPIRLVIVAGEPGGSVPAVRRRLAEAWGAAVLDHAGATEVGPWGVGEIDRSDARPGSSADPEGMPRPALHVIEDHFHPEFFALGTGGPAAPGEAAELVLTTLGRTGAPVIRYRTGDVVRPVWPSDEAIAAGACPWVRLEGGVLGRADDMLVVRGVNIFPGAVDDIVRGFPEVIEYRLTVATRESLDTLTIEIEDRLGDATRVAREFHVRLGLKVEVRVVPIGSLPRFEGKGKRVVDRRDGSRGPT